MLSILISFSFSLSLFLFFSLSLSLSLSLFLSLSFSLSLFFFDYYMDYIEPTLLFNVYAHEHDSLNVQDLSRYLTC